MAKGEPPKPVATIAAPIGEKAANRWGSHTAVTPAELRGALSKTRDECAAALEDAATLARVKVALGLPDSAAGADVVAAVRKLKSPKR